MAVRTGLEPAMVLPTPVFETGRIPVIAPHRKMEPLYGIEPKIIDYETIVLPLNYSGFIY